MSKGISVGVIAGRGLNCERETNTVFRLAGCKSEIILLASLIKQPSLLSEYQILVVPGGFSYGDETGAGNAMGAIVNNLLMEQLSAFLKKGNLLIGICNGCQVLANIGIFPANIALNINESNNYECRWVYVRAPKRSIWFDEGEIIHMPVAHKEGRFVSDSAEDMRKAIILQYCDASGTLAEGRYPINPNGSALDSAAISNADGNVLGIMPHPERGALSSQIPEWPKLLYEQRLKDASVSSRAAGFNFFERTVEHAANHL